MFNGICGAHVGAVDASLGVMGIMRVVGIMGKSWGVIGWPLVLPGRGGDGWLSAEPDGSPTARRSRWNRAQ